MKKHTNLSVLPILLCIFLVIPILSLAQGLDVQPAQPDYGSPDFNWSGIPPASDSTVVPLAPSNSSNSGNANTGSNAGNVTNNPNSGSVTTGASPSSETDGSNRSKIYYGNNRSSITTGITSGNGIFTLQNPLSYKINSLGGLAQAFIDVISYLLILFAVLVLIYTGLQYITVQGNSEKIKELHKKLLWVVVGIAIVIGARLLIQVVINTLQATGTLNPSTLDSVNRAARGQ